VASVTVEYWYFSSGSQLSSPRTDADLSAWTWNSLPRLKNGTTLNHRRSWESPEQQDRMVVDRRGCGLQRT